MDCKLLTAKGGGWPENGLIILSIFGFDWFSAMIVTHMCNYYKRNWSAFRCLCVYSLSHHLKTECFGFWPKIHLTVCSGFLQSLGPELDVCVDSISWLGSISHSCWVLEACSEFCSDTSSFHLDRLRLPPRSLSAGSSCRCFLSEVGWKTSAGTCSDNATAAHLGFNENALISSKSICSVFLQLRSKMKVQQWLD